MRQRTVSATRRAVLLGAAAMPLARPARAQALRILAADQLDTADNQLLQIVAPALTAGLGGEVGTGILPEGPTRQLLAALPPDTLALIALPALAFRATIGDQPDPLAGLHPWAIIAIAPGVLVVPLRSPHRSTAELINAGLGGAYQAGMVMGDRELHMTSSGLGSVSHLLGLHFAAASGVDAQHTPRAPGEFARALDGETGFAFVPLPQALPLLTAGRIRALARAGAGGGVLPEVPPVEAAGPEGFAQLDIPYVLLGRTPPDAGRADRLRQALADPGLAPRLLQAGFQPSTASIDRIPALLALWQAIAAEVRPAVD